MKILALILALFQPRSPVHHFVLLDACGKDPIYFESYTNDTWTIEVFIGENPKPGQAIKVYPKNWSSIDTAYVVSIVNLNPKQISLNGFKENEPQNKWVGVQLPEPQKGMHLIFKVKFKYKKA